MSGYMMAYNSEWHEKMRAALQSTHDRLAAYEAAERLDFGAGAYETPAEREARIMEAIRNIGR